MPALGNPGAVIRVPVTWANCVPWTPTQRHTSPSVPPINHMYVYIEKPPRLILPLYLCLFVYLSSGSQLPAVKTAIS